MPIRALFFDLDDTLLETHHAHEAALRLCCERASALYPGWRPEQLRQGFIIAVLQFHDAPLRLNEAYERNPPAHIRVLGGVHILAGHWEQFFA